MNSLDHSSVCVFETKARYSFFSPPPTDSAGEDGRQVKIEYMYK